jgi:putative flippase GtrA
VQIPSGEKLRFLVAGGCNTLFGIADTFAMTHLMVLAHPAQPALMTSAGIAVSTVLNITVSFFSYKLFVFKTKGNALKEYLRSLLVYLPSLGVSMLVVVPLTVWLRHVLPNPARAPLVATGMIVAFTVVMSFLGHKHITFKKKTVDPVGVVDVE